MQNVLSELAGKNRKPSRDASFRYMICHAVNSYLVDPKELCKEFGVNTFVVEGWGLGTVIPPLEVQRQVSNFLLPRFS